MKHDYEAIVQQALHEPGKVHERYSAFWHYSLGNQWLAMAQLGRAEPINTFPGWKAINRHVKRGAKAIELLMPIFIKAKKEVAGKLIDHDDDGKKTIFVAKRNWFPLSATEGEDYRPSIPDWSIDKALDELKIKQEPFECMDGNCMGYAKPDQRIIAVSPIAYDKLKTLSHEVMHVELHAGMVSRHAPEAIPRDVRECEAEMGAYIVKCALGQTEGLQYSRGYLQNWNQNEAAEKVRYGSVFAAADRLLKAGNIEPEPAPQSQPDRPRRHPEPASASTIDL